MGSGGWETKTPLEYFQGPELCLASALLSGTPAGDEWKGLHVSCEETSWRLDLPVTFDPEEMEG